MRPVAWKIAGTHQPSVHCKTPIPSLRVVRVALVLVRGVGQRHRPGRLLLRVDGRLLIHARADEVEVVDLRQVVNLDRVRTRVDDGQALRVRREGRPKLHGQSEGLRAVVDGHDRRGDLLVARGF